MKTIGITGTGFIVRTAHLPGLAACTAFKGIAKNAMYFADALDRVLREN